MHNLGDDNELDRLSREAAGRYTHPGNADWESLSAELDKVLPVAEKRKRRTVFFWWLLPALLTAGGLTYWMTGKNENTTVTTTNAPAKTVTAKKEEAASTNTVIIPQKENTPGRIIQPLTVENNKASHKANIPNNALALKETPGEMDQKDVTPVPRKELSETVVAKETSAEKGTGQKNNTDQPVTQNTKAAEPVQKPETEVIKQENTLQTALVTPSVNDDPAVTPAQATESLVKSNKPTTRGKGFSFELLAGVDKSTVKFTYGNTPGYNIGALIGYHFNDRLSIHTGGIYTQKNYKLAGADFTAPKGSQVSYYKLETVTGYCKMWEIPLLVRYTVSQSPKHSLFVSTGLSSYFMTKEDYDYFYYFNSQPVTRNSTYNSTDKHIMSIAHLSVGFQNRISNSLSLQVEPYAKIPLGGVGFGNIRLSSFGLNFSVQLRQPAKK